MTYRLHGWVTHHSLVEHLLYGKPLFVDPKAPSSGEQPSVGRNPYAGVSRKDYPKVARSRKKG